MVRKAALAIVVLGVIGGCVTKPVERQIEKSRTYSMSKDKVWERVIEVFATENIQVKTIEKASGLIAAEPASFDPSFADCGAEALAIVVGKTAVMNVFVRPASGGTQVTVNTKFQERRNYDRNFWTVDCFSTGVLEKQILDAISQ